MANWGRISSRGEVDDRRGFAPVMGGLSIGGVALLLVANYLLGGNPLDVLTQLESLPIQQNQVVNTQEFDGEDEYEVFASTVLGSNNDVWTSVFNQNNRTYSPPTLVLFRTATQSGCGSATSDVGPHYCPLDETIYIDETFFDELETRFGAQGGDVAEAYVIAHEVGHHVQHLLGTMDQVRRQGNTNELSIQLELQADCYAGMWANSIKDQQVFEAGEIQEAIDAASAVGDDRIQESVTGQVNPETWTHGSSEQRVTWFNTGYESGELSSCDTFK